MRRFRICDLETVGHERANDWLDPVKPDARCTKPESIAASIAEKTAERAERLALDWDCCRIVALGWVDVGCGDPWCCVAKTEDEERDALMLFWSTYREHDTRLVTYNGLRFDLPVLLTRSVDLGVKHPPLNLNRFKTQHLDVAQYLTREGARQHPHPLRFYAKKYGFTTLDKVAGSEVAALVAAERWDDVQAHCLSDVSLTHALSNKLGLLQL